MTGFDRRLREYRPDHFPERLGKFAGCSDFFGTYFYIAENGKEVLLTYRAAS
jgi:hypothetical protein